MLSTDLFKGYYAALPTPFSKDGTRISEDVLAQLASRNVHDGLDGLYVGGSTGEAFLLSYEERVTVLKTVANAVVDKTKLIAHVGDPNPALSANLAKVAADAGYNAISAVPPFYYKYQLDEIAAHYAWLSGRTDLPFIIYNFPGLSGVKWSANDLLRLLKISGVVGVKNTCGDLYAFEQLRRAAPEATLLHGFDETLLAGLAAGADGGIGSTYNVQAARILDLATAYRNGNMTDARNIQAQTNGLIDVMASIGVLPSLKYLLTLQGIETGPCRPPFQPLSNNDRDRLAAAADRFLASNKGPDHRHASEGT